MVAGGVVMACLLAEDLGLGAPPVGGAPSRCGSERDVVVGVGRGAGGLEFALVGRAVGALRGAVLAGVGGAEELDGVGDDLDRLALAVLGVVFAPLQAAVDRDRAALGEVAGAVLALGAPDGDVEVVGLVGPLAAGVVLAARVARDAQRADRRCPRGVLRSSGSRVRFPVRTTRLMLVADMRLLLVVVVDGCCLLGARWAARPACGTDGAAGAGGEPLAGCSTTGGRPCSKR